LWLTTNTREIQDITSAVQDAFPARRLVPIATEDKAKQIIEMICGVLEMICEVMAMIREMMTMIREVIAMIREIMD
jgi:hypothetical protein